MSRAAALAAVSMVTSLTSAGETLGTGVAGNPIGDVFAWSAAVP